MSIFLSYLIIPLVLLLLGLNIYFRFKIIRKYKALKKQELHFDVENVFKKSERDKLITALPKDQANQVLEFSDSLRRLVFMAAIGFGLILIIFIITYFKSR
jgi:hypothetical protein